MKEASFYKKLENNEVQCRNCAHYCVLKPGERGKCGVRENKKGELYSLVYGKAISCDVDPIEKKPFYHFLPGTESLSIATVGCQFSCKSCQNWRISQGPKLNEEIPGEEISPREIVKTAAEEKLPSISYTYTDPIVFSEYALDTMKLAKQKGIKNTWVTSGFLTEDSFKEIAPYLDAANVDLKSFSDDFYREYCDGKLKPVLDTLKRMKEEDIWVEVTTLLIPTLNDSEENLEKIANFIVNNLGKETPWHISRFSSSISWKLKDIQDTPIKTLQKAHKIGKRADLNYVYTGNTPGLDSEDTYCPNCGSKMIDRTGFSIKGFDKSGKCSKCGQNLHLNLAQ